MESDRDVFTCPNLYVFSRKVKALLLSNDEYFNLGI
jgi:hypothetical protein